MRLFGGFIWDTLLIPPCAPEGAKTQRKQSPRVCNSNCAPVILYVTCLSQKSSRGWKLQPRLLSEKHLELTSHRELGVHRSLLSEIIKCQVFCFVYFRHGSYPYSVLWFIWVEKKIPAAWQTCLVWCDTDGWPWSQNRIYLEDLEPSSTQKSSGSNLFDVRAVKSVVGLQICCSCLSLFFFCLFLYQILAKAPLQCNIVCTILTHLQFWKVWQCFIIAFFPALKIQFLRLNGIYWNK